MGNCCTSETVDKQNETLKYYGGMEKALDGPIDDPFQPNNKNAIHSKDF